jgi:hypothetical protein
MARQPILRSDHVVAMGFYAGNCGFPEYPKKYGRAGILLDKANQALTERFLTFTIAVKAFAVWIGILVLAIANGMLREAVLIPALGKPTGLILSGVLLSGLILVVAYFALPWFGRTSPASYAAIGCAWLCLTLAFEFTFGRLIQGKPWSQLLEAYSFKDGNIWPMVLLITALAPYLVARIRGRT